MQTAGAIGGIAASLIRVPTEVDMFSHASSYRKLAY